MSRDWVRDPRGGAEGSARVAHRHEDPPHLPVGVQAGRVQAPGRREAADQDQGADPQGEAGEEPQVQSDREGGRQADTQVRRGQAQGHQGTQRVSFVHGRGKRLDPQVLYGRPVRPHRLHGLWVPPVPRQSNDDEVFRH